MIRASLASLAFLGLCLPLLSNASTKTTKTGYEVGIEGMHCGSCAETLTKSLQELPNVEKGSVKVVLKENKAFLEMAKKDVTAEAGIRAAIEQAGFKVASLTIAGVGAALAPAQAQAKDAKAKGAAAGKHTCEDCGKEGHTCKECGEKGKAHVCKDGANCKGDCSECAKAGHHTHDHKTSEHGDHKHDAKDGAAHDHAH